jgi:hypothetical protein
MTNTTAVNRRQMSAHHQEAERRSEIRDNTIGAALLVAGMGAGLFGLALASHGYQPGAGKLILGGIGSAIFAAVWIWHSRRTIATAAGNAALDTAATGLRAGRAIAGKADKIASEIKARADQRS